MRNNLPAPIAAFVATLITVGRLFSMTQTTFVSGIGNVPGGSIIEYLFFDYGTLEPNVGIHLLFATIVLWMIIFSLVWVVLSLFARGAAKQT